MASYYVSSQEEADRLVGRIVHVNYNHRDCVPGVVRWAKHQPFTGLYLMITTMPYHDSPSLFSRESHHEGMFCCWVGCYYGMSNMAWHFHDSDCGIYRGDPILVLDADRDYAPFSADSDGK